MVDWNLLKLFSRRASKPGATIAPANDPKSQSASSTPIIGKKTLPPDPRVIKAIGRNHSFESAVADIVDNSLDANSKNILVRFVRSNGELFGLYIVDDGKGMSDADIDRAMTYGGQRTYTPEDLGHFGVGLKAASLGQAKELTVFSKAKGGRPVGRMLASETVTQNFECAELSSEYSASILDRDWTHFSAKENGTAVFWSDITSFPKVVPGGSIDSILDDLTGKLCRHLGLVFHRIIAAKGISIIIDQEDIGLGATGAPFTVEPIDPFGYPRSGRLDYPRTLSARSDRGALELKCHIWPGRSNDPNFRLPGGRPSDYQGFYVYRNDRLLNSGGWLNITVPRDELQLARVEVEMSPQNSALFDMNPEKTKVEPKDAFKGLALLAADGDIVFERYLEEAMGSYRESRKRLRERAKVIAPGQGFSPVVKEALSNEFDYVADRDPIIIRWDNLAEGLFFEVDKDQSLIRLNKKFRGAIIGDSRGALNDAPLVKALLYLLAEPVLRGEVLGARDKDNLSIWQAVLSAAAEAELK